MNNILGLLLILSFNLCANEIDKALELAQQGKFEDAINIILPLANNDNSEAQYWLSKFYGPIGIENKEKSGN